MNEVLNLHRQVEQDLNRKLRLLEKTKTKDDVNYEYVKNIFTKYVLFVAKNSMAEAKQMETLLLELLHYTKQEKEDLEKARQGKSAGGLFSALTGGLFGGKPSVPGITGNYLPPPTGGRSQSVQRPMQKPKAGTETSFYHETPGDFSGISSTAINLNNYRVLQKKQQYYLQWLLSCLHCVLTNNQNMGISHNTRTIIEAQPQQTINPEVYLSTLIKAQHLLHFLTNFSKMDQNLCKIPHQNHSLMLSCFKNSEFEAISLQCTALDGLHEFLQNKKRCKLVRLTFDNLLKTTSITPLCNTILQCCPQVERIVLENWAKPGIVKVDGRAIGEIIRLRNIRRFIIRKIDIVEFPHFIKALRENSTISTFWLQSSARFTRKELHSIYFALNNKQQLKTVKIMDKYGNSQVDWNEFANVIKASKRIRELNCNMEDIKSQAAATRIAENLDMSTSIRKVKFNNFQKTTLSQYIMILEGLEQHRSLNTLDLSYTELHSKPLIDTLCRILQTCSTLETLILASTFATRDESRASCEKLLLRIAESTTLKKVNLSCNLFRKEEEAILPLIVSKPPTIKSVNLANCFLSDEVIAQLFAAIAANNSKIESINLNGQRNESIEKTTQELAKCTNSSLKSLSLSGNDFPETNMAKILKHYSVSLTRKLDYKDSFRKTLQSQSLISIEIEAAAFTAEALSILGAGLAANYTLKGLKLKGEFERDGSQYLSEGLAKNYSVKHLELQNSFIHKKDSVKFFNFLGENKTLVILQASFKVFEIGDSEVGLLINMLKSNKVLRFMAISKSFLSELGIKELKKVERINFWLNIEII
eukprot:TRINITY_DN777_c0_g1_i1.p1 TRINITY_DN777_c0_g1~~TRINITY_DN777_c0_g1_i1.p1  ORF type:complete len:816 (-),score=60.65 TRINITY_DN777_c0_g1_i1:3194-5641(-)